MSPPQAIVFDLDDTLYLEEDYVLSGFAAVARWVDSEYAVPHSQGLDALVKLYRQGVRGDTFNQWLDQLQLVKCPVEKLVDVYRSHRPTLRPHEEAVDLLTQLATKFKLGLISDGYWQVQRNKLDALELARFFGAVVFSDEFGRSCWKPHIRPYQEIANRLAIIPQSAVYVADNPEKDFIGARQAGWKSIRIRHPNGLYSGLEPHSADHAPDWEISRLADLPVLIDQLQNGSTGDSQQA